MILRSILAWFLILVLAFMNGALREALLIPLMGEGPARAISTLILSGLVIVTTWLALPHIHPRTRGDAWLVGVVWLVLTLAFEFLGGHYLFGNSWERLLAEYDVTAGRIWVLALFVTLLAPPVVWKEGGGRSEGGGRRDEGISSAAAG